jgi:hypothetical protein
MTKKNNLNLYNNSEDINKNQNIFDSFNNFIISSDRNLFNKLYSRIKFYEMTKDKNGDIVECGVFKGSGLLTWLKILNMNEPNSIKKVIGFDFFGNDFVNHLENDIDRELMNQVFKRCENLDNNEISLEGISNKILNSGFKEENFDLVKGDIIKTSKEYIKSKPGFRISILYLDMDLEEPTYETLTNLWNNVVEGGVVVFDEYAYHSWSESNGVDRFLKENNLTLHSTKVKSPTAFIIK